MPFISFLAIILASCAVSLGLVTWIRNILLARNLLDHPNERSSHSIPVPRGGGWALILLLIPGMILMAMMQHSLQAHAYSIIAVTLLAAVSWIDDRKGVSPSMRLGLHLLAACIGSLSFTTDQTLFAGFLPLWLDRILMIIGWAWFINLYNFMDGIDGITSIETICIALGAWAVMLATRQNDHYVIMLLLLMIGGCLGFLALNWHPAKIFLGDIGSVPLGFLTGFVLLSLAVKGAFIPALLLPLYYLADSGITITKRALRGEKIWQAHRQHFYQRAAQALGGHDKVVRRVLLANLALIGTAFLATSMPLIGFILGIAVVAILLYWMHKTSLTNG